MARIFDNIDQDRLSALRATMKVSHRSDFCVGYFNLRGWQAIDDLVEIEFVHILGDFPFAPQRATVSAHNDYQDVERELIQ